nr:MAG TPA: hypothetical protein [Caudoviricetes sp.]
MYRPYQPGTSRNTAYNIAVIQAIIVSHETRIGNCEPKGAQGGRIYASSPYRTSCRWITSRTTQYSFDCLNQSDTDTQHTLRAHAINQTIRL